MKISIVVPTYNESKNITPLYENLCKVLPHNDWELIVADDDSPDGTAEVARCISGAHNIRIINRRRGKGLSPSVIDGVQASHGDYIVVMDADGQHDERLIPEMIRILDTQDIDVVSGSRFMHGATQRGLNSPRFMLSKYGTFLLNIILNKNLSDPLTGFFSTSRKDFLDLIPRMENQGYKIFAEYISLKKQARIIELSYNFRPRLTGESNLNSLVIWNFMVFIVAKILRGKIPEAFLSFVFVGGLGAILHILCFYVTFSYMEVAFHSAQLISTAIATIFNFHLNNRLTFPTRQLRGHVYYSGLFKYFVASSIGIFANVSIATISYEQVHYGAIISSLLGAIIDAVWKYTFAESIIWKEK